MERRTRPGKIDLHALKRALQDDGARRLLPGFGLARSLLLPGLGALELRCNFFRKLFCVKIPGRHHHHVVGGVPALPKVGDLLTVET